MHPEHSHTIFLKLHVAAGESFGRVLHYKIRRRAWRHSWQSEKQTLKTCRKPHSICVQLAANQLKRLKSFFMHHKILRLCLTSAATSCRAVQWWRALNGHIAWDRSMPRVQAWQMPLDMQAYSIHRVLPTPDKAMRKPI